MAEVIGIDHIYIAVSNLERSEQFYDIVMPALGFRKKPFALNGEPHIHYYNRHFGYVIRPARTELAYDCNAAGLHHFCFRVETEHEVQEVAAQLEKNAINVSEPKHYPEYAQDYFAVFFKDPDGLVLEVTNYRHERRQRHDNWEDC